MNARHLLARSPVAMLLAGLMLLRCGGSDSSQPAGMGGSGTSGTGGSTDGVGGRGGTSGLGSGGTGASAMGGSSADAGSTGGSPVGGDASVSRGGSSGSGGSGGAAGSGGGGSSGRGGAGGVAGTSGGSPPSDGAAGAESGAGGSAGKGGAGGSAGARSDAAVPPSCAGWAAVDAEGVNGTTGGAGGPVVEITTAAQLASYRRVAGPYILRIMNDLSGEFELGSDKTIEGATNNITIHGSLSFSGTATITLSNLIVRNLKINAVTSTEDGMDIRFAHHVCVEHCEFVDGPDGNLDVVSEANYVTIAYNKFSYTPAWRPLPGEMALNHRFSNLVGSSDTTMDDRGKLKVTFHHNWWADSVVERMPRVRFGDVHVFNNYYSSSGNSYAIAAGTEARLVIENNYFENINSPHIFYDGETTAQIVASGNEYVNVTGLQHTGQGTAFVPPYPYLLESGPSVKATVLSNVGPR